MIKQLLTTVFVLIFLAPQTVLEADDSYPGFKNKPGKVHKYKWPKYKWPKFDKTPSAGKETLEVLSQAIEEIKLKIEALEEQLGDIPEDLTETLATLQDAVSNNSSDIANNSSDISLALSDIELILADIEKILPRLDKNEGRLDELESALADISARLATLESTVGDHELRLLALEQSGSPELVVFSGDFIQPQTPNDQIQQDWLDFRSNATGMFASIEIKNSLNGSVVCSEPVAATDIANKLNVPTGSISTFSCQGITWNVGVCGSGVELNAGSDGFVCSCGQNAVVRPRIGNSNWGGMGSEFGGTGSTCSASDQTLEVILTR